MCSRGGQGEKNLAKGGPLGDEQAKRVGLNEAIFRQVNEQIRSLDGELGVHDGTITVICECGSAECTDRLSLTVSAYEGVRSDSLLYVIAKGHQFPDIERTVERAEGYDVVEKREGAAAAIAAETDPRS